MAEQQNPLKPLFKDIADAIREKDGTTALIQDASTFPDRIRALPANGVPAGGTAGQVLAKKSSADYDTQWVDQTGGGGGITGTLPITSGGTGATTAEAARTNLGAAPTENPVFTRSISMGRKSGTTVGNASVAEGKDTTASGMYSHAEGYGTTAGSQSSHSEGNSTVASGSYSHAEGYGTTAKSQSSHAEGQLTTASYMCSHAEGIRTIASGANSHAEGESTVANGINSHAAGYKTKANNYQYVVGVEGTEFPDSTQITGDRFIVAGKANFNAFRVNASGACYGTGTWNTSGADYAEMFEWSDGNPDHEDRAGLFVTLEGENIRIAGPDDDYILGIVSAVPSVAGDVYDDQWHGIYLRDVFGRTLEKMQDFPAETLPDGTVILPERQELAPVPNPDFDPDQPYQPRTRRPEWDAVGMLGKLVAADDGTCQVNGWCTVGAGGVATHSAERTRYRVMARLDATHVKVLLL